MLAMLEDLTEQGRLMYRPSENKMLLKPFANTFLFWVAGWPILKRSSWHQAYGVVSVNGSAPFSPPPPLPAPSLALLYALSPHLHPPQDSTELK